MLCCSLDHRLLSSSLSSPKSRSSHSVIPCLCLLNTKLSCFRFSHISFCVDILVILTMKPIISCLPCNLLYHSNSVNLSPCRCHVMEASCIAIPTLTNRPSTFVSTDPFFNLSLSISFSCCLLDDNSAFSLAFFSSLFPPF
eukprot:TRINITY_DN36279_c1_g1_i3.p1 TRINITY_DN36279_c1_g1~~TRINITY_DN36279_c1_g1_i3.p1  ORF type:complete len:141 (+),score=3.37 TRINITY_DN36279_c1_g1_i3:252-674(+)